MEWKVPIIFVGARTFPILSATQSFFYMVLQDFIFPFLQLYVVLFKMYFCKLGVKSASGMQVQTCLMAFEFNKTVIVVSAFKVQSLK